MRTVTRSNLYTWMAYVVIAASALSSLVQIERILQRWLVLLLLLLFGFLQSRLPRQQEIPPDLSRVNLLIGSQTLIVAYLLWSTGLGFSFLVLFFILTVNAALYNPLSITLVWIAVFTCLAALHQFSFSGWSGLLRDTMLYGGGYLFLGFVTNALNLTRQAQAQNARLLAELQAKNLQLENYARQVETLAAVEERNRLAREVHDTLGHYLTTSAVQLEAAQRLVNQDTQRAVEMIGNARSQVREALQALRQTVGRLREPVEIELSLPQALRRIAQDFQAATGLVVHLEIPEDTCQISAGQRIALYRAAQEGLTNIQRHAQARQAWLRLLCPPPTLRLEVQDDGLGIEENSQTKSGGFGLLGLKERFDLLGGQVEISPASGGGTLLVASLPVSDPGERKD